MANDLMIDYSNLSDTERMAEVIKNFPRFKIRYQKLTPQQTKHGTANRYQVTITNNAEVYRYTFHESIYNTQRGEMSSDFNILYCAVLDAEAYDSTRTLEDFADNYGYDLYEDRKQAEKAFNGCKTAYESITRLFGTDGYDLLKDIGDNY